MVKLMSGGMLKEIARVSRETSVVTDYEADPSKTVQSEKDNADINVIVKRFGITGTLPATPRLPTYGDYSGIDDFHTAMNAVRRGEEAFMELPAKVRDRFGNNPQSFLEFAANPENIDDLRKMGLAPAKVRDTIASVADVPPSEVQGDDARDSGKRAGKAAKAVKGSTGDSGGEQSGS